MDLVHAGADPAECAAMMAPEVDRLRLAIAEQVKVRGLEIARAHALAPPAALAAGYLRNVYPHRSFEPSAVRAVFTYHSSDHVQAGLDSLVASGHLTPSTGSQLGLTDLGRNLLAEVVSAGDAVAQLMWADTPALGRVTPLAERAFAAIKSGGETFTVMAPGPGNPARLSQAGWFAELLTALRFHRFDSHIAAWRAAGLSVEQIKHLEDRPQRDAIEADTNRRAATPYAALSPAEREQLLVAVTALPG